MSKTIGEIVYQMAWDKTMSDEDKWIHRAQHMRCKTCMYYCPKVNEHGDADLGRCRRHAPTMNGWPVMFPEDWCGDHKLNENANTATYHFTGQTEVKL